MVTEILQITGGVLVEGKCPRASLISLTQESVVDLERGMELETDHLGA